MDRSYELYKKQIEAELNCQPWKALKAKDIYFRLSIAAVINEGSSRYSLSVKK